MTIRLIFTLGALLLLCDYNGHAQDTTAAFKKVDLGVSVQSNVNRNFFHEFWDPGLGLKFDITTPFYLGEFNASGSYTQFNNKVEGLPTIDNFLLSLGWGKDIALARRLDISASGGVLVSAFSFNNTSEEQRRRAEKRFGSTSPESEIGFNITIGLSYEVSPKWSLRLSWNRNIVYTDTKLKLNYVGIGIARTIRMPDWLGEVLR